MKGYRLLADIREDFKVSYQSLDKHLAKLNITKKTIDRRVYIKDSEYDALYKSLSNSTRIKKIAEIDYAEFEAESHKEELLKKEIVFLEKRVKDLEEDITFKNKEIENFHGIIATSSLKIDGLERQIKLLEQTKETEIKKIKAELETTKKLTYKLEDEVQTKELELSEERASKKIIISELNDYKNRTFGQRLKALFIK